MWYSALLFYCVKSVRPGYYKSVRKNSGLTCKHKLLPEAFIMESSPLKKLKQVIVNSVAHAFPYGGNHAR